MAQRQAALLAAGKTGPEYHEPSRPPRVEAEGMHHLMTFAELTGAHVYAVHTSCAEALAEARAAIDRGVRAWVEVVMPHLVLDASCAERPDFEGAKYVMSPPLRAPHHQAALWDAMRSGLVSTVGTDHAPFDFVGQKAMGRDDFTKIPNGIPSVQHRVDLLHHHGVLAGRIDLPTFVDRASSAAARIFGLTGKGRIRGGGGCGPRRLRPGGGTDDLRGHARDADRLLRVRRLAGAGAGAGRHPARAGRRARWGVRRVSRRRPAAAPRANALLTGRIW